MAAPCRGNSFGSKSASTDNRRMINPRSLQPPMRATLTIRRCAAEGCTRPAYLIQDSGFCHRCEAQSPKPRRLDRAQSLPQAKFMNSLSGSYRRIQLQQAQAKTTPPPHLTPTAHPAWSGRARSSSIHQKINLKTGQFREPIPEDMWTQFPGPVLQTSSYPVYRPEKLEAPVACRTKVRVFVP